MRLRSALDEPVWHRLLFQRPIEAASVVRLLRLWGSDPRHPRLVLEVRSGVQVQFLIGIPRRVHKAVTTTILQCLPGTRLSQTGVSRPGLAVAGGVRLSSRRRPLRTGDDEAVARALLDAVQEVSRHEHAVVQLILGPRRPARVVPTGSPGTGRPPADGEARGALRTKQSEVGFQCLLRLGASAPDRRRQRSILSNLLAAARTLEAPGVRFRLVPEPTRQIDHAANRWMWPLTLNIGELVGLLGWPLGSAELPGVPGLHPRRLPPAAGTTDAGRTVATALAAEPGTTLGLSAANGLHHLHVLGPTGTGKSTLLLNLITQDMAAGHAVVVIDPQGDLVLRDVLARVPASRRDDVVVLNPADWQAPVGINPLLHRGRQAEVVADSLLAVFKGLYGDAIGPRSQDILHASLLTLTRRRDASLVMLPLLLTNVGFRRSLTQRLNDPIALEPFWAWFEALSEAERQAVIAPIMNKIRPWLVRPSLRAVLGQRHPKLSMAEVFTRRQILLVSLAHGQLGPEGAALLGSLVVAELWQASLERVRLPAAERAPVLVYLDEFSALLHLPTDLASALARSRAMGVGYTLAHQFLSQLTPAMRAAVMSNVRSRVVFQPSHEDATVLARSHAQLSAEDFLSLDRYELYASLFARGRVTPFASGRTLPPPAPSSDPDDLLARSRRRYGQPLDEVEAGFTALLDPDEPRADSGQSVPGRSPRRPS